MRRQACHILAVNLNGTAIRLVPSGQNIDTGAVWSDDRVNWVVAEGCRYLLKHLDAAERLGDGANAHGSNATLPIIAGFAQHLRSLGDRIWFGPTQETPE
jgi:hypothetical protein